MKQEELFNLLEKTLGYAGIIYKQIKTTTQEEFNNVFYIEYKFTEIPVDSFLFFEPCVSSNSQRNPKLIIKVPYLETAISTSYSYREEEYNLVIETNDGTTRAATQGDVIAYRMCVVRFKKNSRDAILCNSPLYNDAAFSSIKATNAVFTNVPQIKNNSNITEPIYLVTSKQFSELVARVGKLEKLFTFGTADPEEAMVDLPTGSIYIKVEDN